MVWHPDHAGQHAHHHRARLDRAALSPTLLLLLLLTACAGPRERVVLLGAEPGEELTVTTAKGTAALTTPESTADIWKGGKLVLGTLPPANIQERYGAVLATAPEPGRTFILTFVMGKTVLTQASQGEVRGLLEEITRRGAVEVEITGHTDTVGDTLRNDALALARAEAVKGLLVAQGMQTTFVRVTGRGERELLVPTPDNTPESKNRRVEVIVR